MDTPQDPAGTRAAPPSFAPPGLQTASFGAVERRAADSVRGWAVQAGRPAELTVHVNGQVSGWAACDQKRPELAAAGLPATCGFIFNHPAPLAPTDVLEIRLADGTALPVRNAMVDSCTPAQLAGWAMEHDAPAVLDIWVNGVARDRITCARPRPDLARRGLPVACGFVHKFTPHLAPGDVVWVTFTDGAPVKGSPQLMAALTQGSLDRCTTRLLGGWARAGDAPAVLDVFVNGAPAGQVVCDRARPDLAAKGLPAQSGFQFAPATPLQPDDLVSLRFAGTSTELKNSPRRVGHHQEGALDMCSATRVVGWAARDGQPAELEVFVGGALALRLRCDARRPDLAARGLPADCGFAALLPVTAGPADEVAVCFVDGTHLRGSPKLPAADYAAAAPVAAAIGVVVPGLDAETVARARTQDLFAGLAVKEALADAPVAAGFARFRDLLALPDCATVAAKNLVALGAVGKQHRAAWHVLDAGGAAFRLAPPVVVGDGNQVALAGVARPVFLACLKDARLRGRSAVIELTDAAAVDFHADELTRLDDRLAFDPAVFRHDGAILHLLQPAAPPRVIPEAFSLVGAHTDAFGHWLWEYLPKLLAALASGCLPDVPILIDAVRPDGVMPASHRALLETLLPGRDIIELRPFTTVQVGRLWCVPAQMHMPLLERVNAKFRWDYLASPPDRLARLMQDLALRVPDTQISPAGPRVYLARPDSGHRRLVNRGVIEAIAQARGFAIMRPETLDIAGQIALARGAQFLLGPEGSAFFLAFFAAPGTRVCMLDHPHTAGLPLLTAPLAALGVHSTIFTGPFAAVEEEFRHCSNYTIDEIAFAQFLDRWLAGAA